MSKQIIYFSGRDEIPVKPKPKTELKPKIIHVPQPGDEVSVPVIRRKVSQS